MDTETEDTVAGQAPNAAASRDVVRLSVNLAPSTAAALKEAAKEQGTSLTEAVRRMIALWKLISDERRRGNTILVVEGKGDSARYREIVLI